MINQYTNSVFFHIQEQRLAYKKSVKLILLPFAFLCLFFSDVTFAQPEGSLMMSLYVIETTGIPDKASEMDKHFEAHIAHQIDLEKRGIMFGAGPLTKDGEIDGPPTAGLIIVRAASFEEAKKIADADPMHANGIRTYSIRQWSLNEGTFNIRVNFSDQSLEFE